MNKDKLQKVIDELETYITNNNQSTQFAAGGCCVAKLLHIKLKNVIES